MAATAPMSIPGHAPAYKVGGRRMSQSKSPSALKSYLATSPPKQSDLPKPADTESPGDKEATAKSPTSDDYPRPEGGEHPQSPTKDNEKDKDNSEKEKNNKKDDQQHGNKKKDKPAFEHVKQQTMNKNPHVQANFNIKQPAGKTL